MSPARRSPSRGRAGTRRGRGGDAGGRRATLGAVSALSRTFLRYMAFQLPGWMLLGILVAGLWRWTDAPGWLLALGVALFVAKDLLLFPWLRHAYEKTSHEPGEALVGVRARVVEPVDPRGWVRVGAELWKAESVDGPIPAGRTVRVRALDGHVLVVGRDEGGP